MGKENVCYIHLTLVPYIKAAGEVKTKPTQHSVKELREIGIQPDILLCRTDRFLAAGDQGEDRPLLQRGARMPSSPPRTWRPSTRCPSCFHQEGLDEKIIEILNMWTKTPDLSVWEEICRKTKNPTAEVTIAVVGKYVNLRDSYKSLNEALIHGGLANECRVNLDYVDSEEIERNGAGDGISHADGILIPGGFGQRGIEGKIEAIRHAREHGVPFFGICLGMQLAVAEYARNVVGLERAQQRGIRPRHPPSGYLSHAGVGQLP